MLEIVNGASFRSRARQKRRVRPELYTLKVGQAVRAKDRVEATAYAMFGRYHSRGWTMRTEKQEDGTYLVLRAA